MGISDVNMGDQISDLLREAGISNKSKDVAPHFVGVQPAPSISQMLENIDKTEIREDVFLQSVCLELQTLRESLRHRAAMMRLRANEFDDKADELGMLEEHTKEQVFRWMTHLKDINTLLQRHAHIEPEKVKNAASTAVSQRKDE